MSPAMYSAHNRRARNRAPITPGQFLLGAIPVLLFAGELAVIARHFLELAR